MAYKFKYYPSEKEILKYIENTSSMINSIIVSYEFPLDNIYDDIPVITIKYFNNGKPEFVEKLICNKEWFEEIR